MMGLLEVVFVNKKYYYLIMAPAPQNSAPQLAANIFSYLDYRKFLRDVTRNLKAQKKFNVRAFAKKAALRSPGYLKMVIDGRRQLSTKTVTKFCRALDLTGREKIYFEKLVTYNQTHNPDLKQSTFDDLMALQPRSSGFILSKKQNRYFSRPYYVCVREMVALKNFREDPHWIAKRCFPKIRPSQAGEAIATLLDLGLLKRDEAGRLMQTENFVATQDHDTEAVEAYHFHEAMLNKARHALGVLPQKERNYYSLTMPLTKKLYEEIIHDFYAFRDSIVNKVNQNCDGFDDVYQINFQLFPVTKKRGEKE